MLDLGSHDSGGAAKLLALYQKGELKVIGSCLCRFSFRTALARLRADTWVKKVKTITNILGLRSQELLNYTLHCVITVFGLVSCSPAPAASPGVACRNLRSAKGFPCAVRFPGLDSGVTWQRTATKARARESEAETWKPRLEHRGALGHSHVLP